MTDDERTLVRWEKAVFGWTEKGGSGDSDLIHVVAVS